MSQSDAFESAAALVALEGDGVHDTTIEANWLFSSGGAVSLAALRNKAHDYYVMHLADAVHAIAVTEDDHLVLVRQFRAGSGRDSLETPADCRNPERIPAVAGRALEETGYAGDPAVLVGTVWSVPSILTSRLATIVVTHARRVAAPALDETEEVSIELVPVAEVPRLIREGRIDHALAVVGLLWWLGTRPGGLVM
ncbi:MAG: NUDIX hydrolase [Isosphaeraceae bacterium]